MLIVVIWWVGDIKFVNIFFLVSGNIEFIGLFVVLLVMFWCFVGLEVFVYFVLEFKNLECDFFCVLMIGLLLVGLVYWGCMVVVLYFDVYGEKMVVVVLFLKIVV